MFLEGSWWNDQYQLEVGFYEDFKGRFVDGSYRYSEDKKYIFRDFDYEINSDNQIVISTDFGLSCEYQLNKDLSDTLIVINYKGKEYQIYMDPENSID